jgi:hypothetical protein
MGTRMKRIMRIKTDFLVALRPLLPIINGLQPPPAGGYSRHKHEKIDVIDGGLRFASIDDRFDIRPAGGRVKSVKNQKKWPQGH